MDSITNLTIKALSKPGLKVAQLLKKDYFKVEAEVSVDIATGEALFNGWSRDEIVRLAYNSKIRLINLLKTSLATKWFVNLE